MCELPEQLVILQILNFDLVLWFSPAIKKIWFKAKAHWLMFYTDVIMFTQMCFESLIMEDFLGPATWQAVVIWKLNLYNIYLQSFSKKSASFLSPFRSDLSDHCVQCYFHFEVLNPSIINHLLSTIFFLITQVHIGQYLGLLWWKGVSLLALSHLPIN